MDKCKGGKGGTVVNVGSRAGLGEGMNIIPVYKATKHAVIGFSRAFGVRIAVKINVMFCWIEVLREVAINSHLSWQITPDWMKLELRMIIIVKNFSDALCRKLSSRIVRTNCHKTRTTTIEGNITRLPQNA
jgi:short-subunit dehydrogenase involved in D-alanine esterification of teichoic acids